MMAQEKRGRKEKDKQEDNYSIHRQLMNTKIKTIVKISFFSVVALIVLYNVFLLLLHCQSYLMRTRKEIVTIKENKSTYWIYAKSNDTTHLKHVFAVLERLGFEYSNNKSQWDLLWAHDYPFRVMSSNLKNLQHHQRVNHFPGCGYITNKVDLSTSKGHYIPVAFKVPEDKEVFLQYANAHPNKTFVQKSNDHRGIKIIKTSDMNFTITSSFIQEFIDRPYLVDGYKFDIGIYTVITSIDPLRVYTYKGDVLLRFCPVQYYPFDANILDKYVVGDDYLPIWNVLSLKDYYVRLGYSMKDSLDAYIKSQGKNPKKIWSGIQKAIQEITLMKENQMKEIVKRFGNGRNFFELIRFDFTIDEDLNVYTMEANMSPNLSSAHYLPNQLLYEQVLFNLFALIGIGKRVRKSSLESRNNMEEEMEVATKNLVVLPELCTGCDDCFRIECQLCSPCFTPETKLILSQSYIEHQNKMDYQRTFPPPITKGMVLKDYSLKNQLLVRWYQGKCELDNTWCI